MTDYRQSGPDNTDFDGQSDDWETDPNWENNDTTTPYGTAIPDVAQPLKILPTSNEFNPNFSRGTNPFIQSDSYYHYQEEDDDFGYTKGFQNTPGTTSKSETLQSNKQSKSKSKPKPTSTQTQTKKRQSLTQKIVGGIRSITGGRGRKRSGTTGKENQVPKSTSSAMNVNKENKGGNRSRSSSGAKRDISRKKGNSNGGTKGRGRSASNSSPKKQGQWTRNRVPGSATKSPGRTAPRSGLQRKPSNSPAGARGRANNNGKGGNNGNNGNNGIGAGGAGGGAKRSPQRGRSANKNQKQQQKQQNQQPKYNAPLAPPLLESAPTGADPNQVDWSKVQPRKNSNGLPSGGADYIPKNIPTPGLPTPKEAVVFVQDRIWEVEAQTGKDDIIVNVTDMSQQVLVLNCEDCTVQVKGKVSLITLDKCRNVGILFEDILSQVEVIHSSNISLQASGSCPIVSIDSTNKCMIYLEDKSRTAKVVQSRSTELTIVVLGEEQLEIAVPSQFVSELNGNELVTTPSSHI